MNLGDTMRCLTLSEAKNVLGPWLGEDGTPRRGEPNMKCVRFYVGSESFRRLFWVVFRLLESLGAWEDAWLWLDERDTWNRQGLHLYTRLRQSYGDLRLLSEAPVHQFHGFEANDLCSFMAVALLNEWAFAVVTSHDYGRLFVSRSSGVEIWLQDDDLLHALKASLTGGGIAVDGDSTMDG